MKPSDWGKLYWSIQQGRLGDDRFNYNNFSRQPMWLISQAISAVHQNRNFEQLTIARFLQTYINSKIDTKKTQPIKNEGGLLPHPHSWAEYTEGDSKFDISPATAREILTNFNKLNSSHKAILDSFLSEIQRRANK